MFLKYSFVLLNQYNSKRGSCLLKLVSLGPGMPVAMTAGIKFEK